MARQLTIRRITTFSFAVAAMLFLSACLITPGRFVSSLDLRRDGGFSFSYQGQIYMLALSKLAEMGQAADAAGEEFTAAPCFDDNAEERDCTDKEVATQRSEWEAAQERRRESARKERESMQALLGGIDPSDPGAAEELAARLRRQAGWRKVEYKGDGLYEVDFAISSSATHDFAFPTIEGFPPSNPFVLVTVRQDRKVRLTAPGFSAQDGNGPMTGLMGGMAGALGGLAGSESGEDIPTMPHLDGTFRLTTDGAILANNTDEGPTAGTAGKVLEWKITRQTAAAPMALVDLAAR